MGDITFASTSTDNSVTYDAGSPAVTVNQEATQADPTASSPVLFTVVFSEAINPATFSTADITQGGTASGITWTLTASGGNTWDLSAVLSTSGTVIPSIAASQVQDLAGNPNTASSSTDNSVMYTIVPSAQVLQTGQALCYDENGVVVSCGGTGQDADLLKGLAWAAPRFTDNGDGTITDNSTGLIWTADMNLMNGAYSFLDTDATAGDGIVYWQTALDFAAQLNTDTYGSRTDWRIPNILELMSLMNYGTNDVPAWLASFGFSNTGILLLVLDHLSGDFNRHNSLDVQLHNRNERQQRRQGVSRICKCPCGCRLIDHSPADGPDRMLGPGRHLTRVMLRHRPGRRIPGRSPSAGHEIHP